MQKLTLFFVSPQIISFGNLPKQIILSNLKYKNVLNAHFLNKMPSGLVAADFSAAKQ